MKLIDGKAASAALREMLKKEVENLEQAGITPGLVRQSAPVPMEKNGLVRKWDCILKNILFPIASASRNWWI